MEAYTVDEIMQLGPCLDYPRERVAELWKGRERLPLLEICDLPIPPRDILWVVLVKSRLPKNVKLGLVCDFAEHVLPIFEQACPNDNRPRRAIELARSSSTTAAELFAAARVAARVAESATLATTRAAAWAAEFATWAAASWAAEYASWATESAARSAARSAEFATLATGLGQAEERNWQLERVKEVLNA